MRPEEIKKKVLEYDWCRWLDRPFGAFILSLFMGGNSWQAMKKIGVDVAWPAALFQAGAWYESEEVCREVDVELQEQISRGLTARSVAESCDEYRGKNRPVLEELLSEKGKTAREKFQIVVDVLSPIISYIWITHAFEHYYAPILKREVAKHFAGDVDTHIGDLSYPEKKNSHNYLEEELVAGGSAAALAKKFGWIKVRDAFSDPFAPEELEKLRKKLLSEKRRPVPQVSVPKALLPMVREARAMVYLRTLRTDVFYEFLFLARPITAAVAREYGLDFRDLRDYSVRDLLAGRPVRYPFDVACAYYKEYAAFFNEPIVKEEKVHATVVKGAVAYRGAVQGRVAVVRNVAELHKVQEGDVLVAGMTTPSFVMAMQKAAAFVTDEGGITCHAAIVAREMQKPCIIGTRTATKVLKDGMTVEVDANHGLVRILKGKE